MNRWSSGFAALLELDCTAQALERRTQERVKLPRRGCVAELAANNAPITNTGSEIDRGFLR